MCLIVNSYKINLHPSYVHSKTTCWKSVKLVKNKPPFLWHCLEVSQTHHRNASTAVLFYFNINNSKNAINKRRSSQAVQISFIYETSLGSVKVVYHFLNKISNKSGADSKTRKQTLLLAKPWKSISQ